MRRVSFDDLTAGQMFTYQGERRLLSRSVGIGQLLAFDIERRLVFVELFGSRGEELVPFLGFVPLTFDAFVRSKPSIAKVLDVPADWEDRRNLWLARWRDGDAGVFSVTLREIVAGTLESVGRARDVEAGEIYIDAAFPRRDASGAFRIIEAHVRQMQVHG